ncbi:MAG: hypothetical protein HUK24_07030, partial [Sphaerochaetaceae bacterium]|nr:hypothetical protein [Sphaerochaetaceae bacterium]
IVDIHVHAGPSVAARALDAADMLKAAEEAGYRGFVVKDHYFPTMMGAKMVEEHLGNGSCHVFGGIAMNNSIGLYNLVALDAAVQMGAKFVWMPTLSSKAHIDRHKGHFVGSGNMTVPEKPEYYLDEKGELKPEVIEVLNFMAKHPEVVFATGHGTVTEIDKLIPAAFEAGVKKVFINHPHFIVNAPFEAVNKWVNMGAYVEINAVMFDGVSPAIAGGQGLPLSVALEYIEKLPTDHIVIDTDLGQKNGTHPVEGMYRFLTMLLEAGVPYEKIEMMAKVNPAKLMEMD